MSKAFTLTQPLNAPHPVLAINGQERYVDVITHLDGASKAQVYVQMPGIKTDRNALPPVSEGSKVALGLLRILSEAYQGQGDEGLAEFHSAMQMLLEEGMLLANPNHFDPGQLDPSTAKEWRKQLRNAKDKGVWHIVYDMSRKSSFLGQVSKACEEIPVTLWDIAG